MDPGEKKDIENIFDINLSEVGARGIPVQNEGAQSTTDNQTPVMNIDNSQENADFVKFRQLDIPGISSLDGLLEYAGIDRNSENINEEIVRFADSHPWLDNINPETAWIINSARQEAEKKKQQ